MDPAKATARLLASRASTLLLLYNGIESKRPLRSSIWPNMLHALSSTTVAPYIKPKRKKIFTTPPIRSKSRLENASRTGAFPVQNYSYRRSTKSIGARTAIPATRTHESPRFWIARLGKPARHSHRRGLIARRTTEHGDVSPRLSQLAQQHPQNIKRG